MCNTRFNAFALLLLFNACIACGKDSVLSGRLTFVSGTVLVDGRAVQVNDAWRQGTELSTGDDSIAVVQFEDRALLTITANSAMRLEAFVLDASGSRIELFQQAGCSLNKVSKGETGYRVRTGTMTAAVRGTVFSVYAFPAEESAKVSVLEGEIAISSATTQPSSVKPVEEKPVIIPAGYEAVVERKKDIKPVLLREAERERLSAFGSLAFIGKELPDPEKKPVVSPEVKEKITKDVQETVKPADPKVEFKKKLDAIKKRNQGKLDRILLRNGTEFLGMVIERGLVFKIETPAGLVSIPRGDIVEQSISY